VAVCPRGLHPVPRLLSHLPGIPARGPYQSEPWCCASGRVGHQTRHCSGGDNEPGVVLWGDSCPQRGETGSCSHPQGPPKVMCWGGCRKSRTTGGRGRFVTCHGMTRGDRSRTSVSGESGQAHATSPPRDLAAAPSSSPAWHPR